MRVYVDNLEEEKSPRLVRMRIGRTRENVVREHLEASDCYLSHLLTRCFSACLTLAQVKAVWRLLHASWHLWVDSILSRRCHPVSLPCCSCGTRALVDAGWRESESVLLQGFLERPFQQQDNNIVDQSPISGLPNKKILSDYEFGNASSRKYGFA